MNQFYGGSHTLWDLALDVPEGSCTCLMGRNGVGKTTLLRAIMGLVPIRSGKIEFAGEAWPVRPSNAARARGSATCRRGARSSRSSRWRRTCVSGSPVGATADAGSRRVLRLFPVLREMLARRGGDLSGGQQQQLAIGRALASEPRFLILDEPAEGIQPNIVKQIGDAILHLNRDLGLTVLLVEQKLPFARRVASRFCILDRGRKVAEGAIAELDDGLVRDHLTV